MLPFGTTLQDCPYDKTIKVYIFM